MRKPVISVKDLAAEMKITSGDLITKLLNLGVMATINKEIDFDIKGTVIPQSMRDDVESVIRDPRKMIDFFYDQQSKGRRYDIQNRLFIVHHSCIVPAREFYLRCAWQSKRQIYKTFCINAENISFYRTHNVIAGVIFILEREKNKVDYSIFGI